MAEFYTYQKKRKEFGRPCTFTDTEIKHCGYFPQQRDGDTQPPEYKHRNPNFIQLDNITELSEHSVNTERVKTSDKGMYHKEGGWPPHVDATEQLEINKHKKKIEKEEPFQKAVKELCQTVEKCIYQNNQIDLFEEYFQNEQSEHIVENLSSKTLMLFKDDSEICKRSVSEISWYPEGPQKLAVSYAIMRFQQMPDKMPTQAYIWDINNPNNFDVELRSPSPVTNISYNTKIADQIGGGCYNGLLAFWDGRKGKEPTHISPVELSHYDPVTHFQWLMSRTGQECVTTSTDGRTLWWDLRRLDQGPVESLNVIESGDSNTTVGATVLEYNVDAGPSKFLIGTEQGAILTANKKLKRDVEITTRYGLEQGRHLGPVYAINRSQQIPKYFLSVGDWSAKIWVEDLKVPIIRTKYHGSYLSDGCWSPTRPGAFFLARRDGWMDVWDYYYRQNEIAFSHKVSDAALTCLKININSGPTHHSTSTGKLVAVGDQDGTVTVLELCESLYVMQPKEKDIINEMFDREMRKEKNLEAIKKQQDLQRKTEKRENVAAKEKWEKKKADMINTVEQQFSKMRAEAEKNRVDDDLAELDSPGFKKKSEDNRQEVIAQVHEEAKEQAEAPNDQSVHSQKSKKSGKSEKAAEEQPPQQE